MGSFAMPALPPDRRLQLAPEALRRLGYRIVDLLVEHEQSLASQAVARVLDWRAARERLREPFAEQGIEAGAVLDQIERDVLGAIMHVDHPRFFAFVPGPSNLVSALAEALAAGYNVFAGTWMEGSGPAEVELRTIDWLRTVCGLPETAFGLLVSGGSVANLTALAVARRVKLGDSISRGVIYFSDQTHSAVERALRILGFGERQMRRLPSDEHFRLPLGALERAVAADRKAGLTPFCVVANAGTTNTGAVDPLRELAAWRRQEGLWLHADGAYGAAAALSERGRELLDGLGSVDSLALDPHKWLFQPFEAGCVLVRHGDQLRDTFRIVPPYLEDVYRQEGVNFCDYGIQLTRSFRALKLWTSLKVFGIAAFRQAIEQGFRLAEFAEARLRSNPVWEIVSPAQMAVVCFRYLKPGLAAPDTDAFQQRLADAIFADGFAALTTTVLKGRRVLRMCTINPRTTEQDIDETIARLERLA
jgi:aromatic-L-amino-acid decarboxylase